MLTFLHCEFDALCHHFNKAFMYVCMYVPKLEKIHPVHLSKNLEVMKSLIDCSMRLFRVLFMNAPIQSTQAWRVKPAMSSYQVLSSKQIAIN